jgi:hypothetical protein
MRLLVPLSLLVTHAPVLAQSTFVVPSKANFWQPGVVYADAVPQAIFLNSGTLPSGVRTQYLYDVADIPIATGLLTSVAFRAPANRSALADSYQARITMSMGPNPSTAPSRTFAANHGLSPSTVFQGVISLPTAAASAWPAPWQTPVLFSSPFAYAAANGSTLVVELDTISSRNLWVLEGYGAEVGGSRTELHQPGCLHSGNRPLFDNWGQSPNLVPGGSFYVGFGTYPTNTPSLAANLLFISPTGLGSSVGPYVTPFLLSRVAPARPNCLWAIGINNAVTLPMEYVTSGNTAFLALRSELRVPNDARLQNAVFYTQNLAADVDAANNLALFPSVAVRWLIGTNRQIPVSMAFTSYVPGFVAPEGLIATSTGAALRFAY